MLLGGFHIRDPGPDQTTLEGWDIQFYHGSL